MNTKRILCFAFVVFDLLSIGAAPKALTDVPVSDCANLAYLSDMNGRLWWNADWKKRAAILVSNMSKVRTAKTTIDFVFDVGEKIDPAAVRVVTPWEVEIPCVCEKDLTSTAVRLLFQTDLREMENRPFFVYWDNPDAKPSKVRTAFALDAGTDEVYVNNGCVEVVFDNLHRTPGLIRRIKVNASPAPDSLLWRTTGYAWEGFVFETEATKMAETDVSKIRNSADAQIHKVDSDGGWSPAIVTTDNAIRKTVTFTNGHAAVDFTFYAGESRVNYAYRLAPGLKKADIGISWAPGGGIAHDDFYYPGSDGKILTIRAALDWISDSEKSPLEYYRFPWFGEGWYAFSDRLTHDTVGMVFDRAALDGVHYLAGANHAGEVTRLSFLHNPKAGECASGGGALIATVGGYKDVENACELQKNPPRVFVAKVQTYREIKAKPRDLVHDWCVNYNVGGWKSAKPLPGDEWAKNIVTHLRERGANTLLLGQLTDYGWTELPVPKDLYGRICAYMAKEEPGWKAPPWDGSKFKGDNLRKICAAAHAKGMAVCTWHSGLPGVKGFSWARHFDPEYWKLIAELQALYPKCGVDSVFCASGGSERQHLPADMVKKFGRQYWKWADPNPYFDCCRWIGSELKKFYDYSHRVNPAAAVMVINSDNGELDREVCMPYYPNAMDTLFCEFVEMSGDFDKIKHVAKRLRSYFDNEVGRTIHAHYYCMKLNHANRIFENEQHFICGINGFSNEAMTYENTEAENSQFQADFYRFAAHTRLGDKAAKMSPVKNLAVLRDAFCFEEDIRKKRTRTWGWGYPVSLHDLRVSRFASIPSFNYDIVMNPHFKSDSLKRYKVVYLPEDDVLSPELAKEALAFVANGGGLVLEGTTGMRVKKAGGDEEWNDCEVVKYGKGRIVWTKEILTDCLIKNDLAAGEKIKKLVASVGGEDPMTIVSKTLDGVLQEGPDGQFLGVYNRGKESDSGNVILRRLPANASGMFVLDVKRGVRFPYRDGFGIEIGPEQCGFYLIGDDSFTAVPTAAEAIWTGSTTTSTSPDGSRVLVNVDRDFKPLHCVEFVTPAPRNYAGLPARIERSERAMIVRHRFCAAEAKMLEKAKTEDFEDWMARNADGARCYTPAAVSRALNEARYVHVQTLDGDGDEMFADCKDELKALLRRGGGILFSRTRPGPNARKFLNEVGVYDPSPSLKGGFMEPAVWSSSVPTNHVLNAVNTSVWNKKVGASSKYADWDKAKQYAPFVDKLQNEYALTVVQENVLGAGKVVFSNDRYIFMSWYENFVNGDAMLSFLLGMSAREHAEKVMRLNGGPGTVVK